MQETTTSPKVHQLHAKNRLLLFLVLYVFITTLTVMWLIGNERNWAPSPLVSNSRTLGMNSTNGTSTTVVGQGWTLGNASDRGPHAAPGTIAILTTNTTVVGQDRTTGIIMGQGAHGGIETVTTSTESAAATMNTTVVKEAETTDRPSTSTKYLRYNLKWYNKSLLNKSVNASYHIWFLETSSRRKLKARQACSVESACRHNSDFTVHLLSNGNISSSDCPYHDALSKIPNFRSAVLNASVILADTPLAPLQAKEGPLTRSSYATEHLSDFLRLAMLWIHGGIYIDLDVIVMKSLEGIRNTVFYESEQYNNLATTVLFFDKHHPALGALMDETARMYRPATWRTVPEAVETLLSDAVFSRIVNIASSSAFLPVYYPGWKTLFDPKDASDVLKTINGSYGVHFWNSISKGERVVPGSGCALDLLARAHCPEVHRLALSDGDF
ncbi:lactosylceramide 4-alpha-galactosyltransferase-like isoform X2 [Dermacentor albipictus]|uniref:lactosylceramide 4-alpha-galactosyltransferase-like isoform X2 n=1 Tax=Dermacentor albipictus TaxID=60249 RepID=UPI0038FC0524